MEQNRTFQAFQPYFLQPHWKIFCTRPLSIVSKIWKSSTRIKKLLVKRTRGYKKLFLLF